MTGPTRDTSSIEIREINEISEMRAVERRQKEVWGVGVRKVLPALILIPMIELVVCRWGRSANELEKLRYGFLFSAM
jgi:hypothetical protein